MGLRDITIHRTSVEYRDNELLLRGVCTTDIMVVAQDYGPEMALIFGKMQSGAFDGDTKKAIMAFTREMPEMIGAIIALASDDYDPDTVATAQKLPFTTQVEAVEAIFHETFYSEAEVKKLVESLTRMITAVSGAMTEMEPLASLTGIGESDVKLAS